MNQVQTDVPREGSIYQTVVNSIAEAEGTDPTDLTPPLFEVVDPESLESLFTDGQGLGKVIFNYNNYEVNVYSDRYVSVKSHST